jgi:hypothetical protein
MKAFLSLAVIAALILTGAAPASLAAPRQVIPGTQIHLSLLNGISSAVAKEGDPFIAVITEPVFLGNQLLIPAGTRVNGTIGTIQKAKRFSLFRGQAYMNLSFKSMEMDSRLIPVQMSILGLEQPRIGSEAKRRKDIKITEGEVVEEKHDYKGDAIGMAIGGGGGSVVGLVFSNVARGFGIGIAGGAIYVVARKGKEVEMPAQTGILVRIDNTVTLPPLSATAATGDPAYANSSR